MRAGAIMSDCGQFRLHLHRMWGDAGKVLAFVMLNPSTADGYADDPTIRRCIGFGRALGFGGVVIVNLYAFRATDPLELRRAGWPRHPSEDRWITTAVDQATFEDGEVCCAWGSMGGATARAAEVRALIRKGGARPMCLGTTAGGAPRHPLYLPGSARLKPYESLQ